MITGIGTDFLKMSRIPDVTLKPGDPFREKTFTEKEKFQAMERPGSREYFCTRFAAKEAIFKALGLHPDVARLSEIEILDDETGAPHCFLHGTVKQLARMKRTTQVHISITYDDGYAQAFAIAESAYENTQKGVYV